MRIILIEYSTSMHVLIKLYTQKSFENESRAILSVSADSFTLCCIVIVILSVHYTMRCWRFLILHYLMNIKEPTRQTACDLRIQDWRKAGIIIFPRCWCMHEICSIIASFYLGVGLDTKFKDIHDRRH